MEHHVAFLRAIAAAPEAEVDRLVYADWLDEQGDPLALLLRVQSRLRSLTVKDAPYEALARRERMLLKKHRRRWRLLRKALAAWPDAQRCLAEHVLKPIGIDPDGFTCPGCGTWEAICWDLRNPMMLHWVLNPGLAVNELLLGQRIPKVMWTCRGCMRQFTRCGACRAFLSLQEPPFTRGFAQWFGCRCPQCGGNVPMLRNLTAGVAVTAGKLVTGYGWLWGGGH
jgi:uncharacterized protein (TIGR02996 family)